MPCVPMSMEDHMFARHQQVSSVGDTCWELALPPNAVVQTVFAG